MLSRNFLFITLLVLIFSCSKDPAPRPGTSGASNQPAIDRDPPPPCEIEGLPVLEIRFRYGTVVDYTEQQVRDYLQCAGLNQTQINDYIARLFNANSSTPSLADEVVRILLNCPAFVPPPPVDADCFEVTTIACGPFYPPPASPPCPNCPISEEDYCPSRIDLFGHWGAFVNEEGCMWVALWDPLHVFKVKKTDGAILQFNFSSIQLVKILMNSGMSSAEANQALQDIAQGVMTAREFWELFQYRVAPYYPDIQNLSPEEKQGLILFFVQFETQYPALPAAATSRTLYQVRGAGELFCDLFI